MRLLTPSGYRELADLEIGDELLAYDVGTGAPIVNTLLGVEMYTPERFAYYEQDPVTGQNLGDLIVPPFAFYVVNGVHRLFRDQSVWANGNVTHASILEIGDTLYDDADLPFEITSVTTEERTHWWRLHVSGDASYIADGLTLHNASRFWVGGTGNWSSSNTTNWSGSSGGGGGSSVPTSSDTVTTDTLSNATAYAITVTATANCSDVTFGAPLTGALTFAGSSALNVFGSLSKAAANVTWTYSGTMTYSATATGKTITHNGVASAGAVTFNGVGGGWTLQDAFSIGSAATSILTLTNGALNTNGQTVTTRDVSSNVTNTRSLTLGATAWTVTNVSAWTINATGLTFSAGTSSLTFSGSGVTFAGGGLTYYDVAATGVSGQTSISGANTFHNLSRTAVTANSAGFSLSANQTVTGTLTMSGNSARQRFICKSATYGTPVTITAAAVSLTNVTFSDITGAGAATWSGTSIGDALGNSNITFTAPKTSYAVTGGSAKDWDGTATWALSSGGATAAGNFPLPQDAIVIDANSGSGTINANRSRWGASINFTGATLTVDLSVAVEHYGAMTLASGMGFTGAFGVSILNRSAANLTSNGKSFPNDLTIGGVNGVVTLQDNLAVTGALSVSDSIGARLIAGTRTVTYASMSGWVFYGDSAVTEANDSNSAAGTVAVSAAAAVTEVADTLSAAVTSAIASAFNVTEAADTLSGVGQVAISASLVGSQSDAVLSAGTVAVVAALSATEGADSLSSASFVWIRSTDRTYGISAENRVLRIT